MLPITQNRLKLNPGTECVHFDDPYAGMVPGKKQNGKHIYWKNLWGKVYTNKKKRSSMLFAIYISMDGSKFSRLSHTEFLSLNNLFIHIYPHVGIDSYLKTNIPILIKPTDHNQFKYKAQSLFTHSSSVRCNFRDPTPEKLERFRKDIRNISEEYISGDIKDTSNFMDRIQDILHYYKYNK